MAPPVPISPTTSKVVGIGGNSYAPVAVCSAHFSGLPLKWQLPAREFGSFVSGIAAPLGIGTVELADGTSVQGFVCEAHATTQAQDISHLGGWQAYLRSLG
jgi:hypothetical protein